MYKYTNLKLKRFVPIIVIAALLVGGLNFYRQNKDLITNFKPYYYKSYLAAAEYDVKSLALGLIGKSQVQASTGLASPQSIPVLLYHGVITNQPDGANITIDNFISQMLALKKQGYQTISMDQYYQAIYNGKPVPAKSFLLTFDDGRKDSYYPADPILNALHYRATMFVITGASFAQNSRFYLSQAELLRMKSSGRWDLQAHGRDGHFLYPIDEFTTGHFYTNKLWLSSQNRYETDQEFQQRVTADLQGAKDDMKNYLGIDSVGFAFPFGDLGEDQSNYSNAKSVFLDAVGKVYKLGFYQFWPGRGYSQNYIGSRQLLNERIEVQPSWNGQSVVDSLSGGTSKPLPYAEVPNNTSGWLLNWGSNFFTRQGMILTASTKSTGAAVALDGSDAWRDYTYSASAQLIKGSNIRLLARVQDSNNYVACSFNPNLIEAQQIVNGQTSYKSGQAGSYDLTAPNAIFGITVKGNTTTCLMNGTPVISVTISAPTLQSSGGIGFVVYDPAVNTVEGILKHVEVTEVK